MSSLQRWSKREEFPNSKANREKAGWWVTLKTDKIRQNNKLLQAERIQMNRPSDTWAATGLIESRQRT